VLIFAAGILRYGQFNDDVFAGNLSDQSIYLQGIVKVDQVLKNKNSSVSLKCQRVFLSEDGDDKGNLFQDRYILVFIKSSGIVNYFPGDILMIKGWVSEIKGPANPYAFNAKEYYKTISIRYQIFCKEEETLKDTIAEKSVSRFTAQWQSSLSTLVRKHISPQVAQLTNALVWGDRSDMDDDVRDAFAGSGAMHVLSVSGMHVAIIYSMLLVILGAPGAGNFLRRLLRFICYTLAILLYVGLTGACPAVVRAGLMIILYLFGKSMGWNTQVWNLLGFAAFMMIWINPYVANNIGFQLSFLAMAGILLFSKPMIQSIAFKNKLLHMIWEITVLSIVAQVFILPILLGQFHQFPLTFIISSLVAVPAGYMIVFGAMLNVFLSFLHISIGWKLLDWIGSAFIQSMKWMAGLNPEMHFSLPPSGGILLMSMAILFSLAIVFSWPFGKKLAYTCGVLTIITLGCHRNQQWSERELIIYHSYKGLITDITFDGHCISIYDCDVPAGSIEFATRGYRCHRDIIDVTSLCVEQEFESPGIKFKTTILKCGQTSILWWEGSTNSTICETSFTHLILDQCPDIIDLEDFLIEHPSIEVIIPAHINRKQKKLIEDILDENQINFRDIDRDGYYIMSI
jgi:competence protein ComEC